MTYTKETFDYVPVKVVGLHVFRDIRYFCRDKDKFAQLMLEHLPKVLEEIAFEHHTDFGYEAKDMHFEEWDYWRSLPQKVGNFELFITPDNPVPFINGSYIFLNYSDFAHESQLYFLFNGFRVEVFGEMLQQNIPVTTDLFTVPEENDHGQRKLMKPEKILPRFTELLEARLLPCLERLGQAGFETL